MATPPPTGGLHPEITLPHAQEWTLYHNSFSLCSKKVRVCMAELGLPCESRHIHLIETGAYQSVSREYLRINPAGTVPVLLHEGHPVYESHEQIVYAAKHAGERGRSLLPEDPARARLVAQWSDCASLVGNPLRGLDQRAGHCIPGLTLPLFATMVARIPYREIARGLLTHPNKERPLLFLTLRLLPLATAMGLAPLHRVLARSREAMGRHLDRLAALLSGDGRPWIAGADFTLADVSWVVLLDRLAEADWAGTFWEGGRRPEIEAYWKRLCERASYRNEVLGRRCPITLRGIDDLARAKRENPSLRALLEDR